MCQLHDGSCENQNNRHPDDKCLICSTDGNWLKQPRSNLVDAFGATLLNGIPSNTQTFQPIYSGNGKITTYYENLSVVI